MVKSDIAWLTIPATCDKSIKSYLISMIFPADDVKTVLHFLDRLRSFDNDDCSFLQFCCSNYKQLLCKYSIWYYRLDGNWIQFMFADFNSMYQFISIFFDRLIDHLSINSIILRYIDTDWFHFDMSIHRHESILIRYIDMNRFKFDKPICINSNSIYRHESI